MTVDELVEKLKEEYQHARKDEKSVAVVLFFIKYASEMKGVTNAEIARKACLVKPNSYTQEMGYGRRLAEYVTLKADTP